MNKINYFKYIKNFIFVIILIIVIYLIYMPLIKVSIPFITSLIIAYLLSPIVKFLMSKKLSKILSILIIYIVFFITTISLLKYLLPLFYSNINELFVSNPTIIDKYKLLVNEFIIKYDVSNLPDSLKQGISQNIKYISTFFNSIIIDTLSTFSWIIANIFYIALIPFITFYFLKDGEELKEKLTYVIPVIIRDDAIVTWYRVDLVLKRFIRGEMTIALIVGVLTWSGMYIIGVKFSLVLGFIAGVTNIIPYLGPFLGVIPCLIVAFIQSPLLALKAGFIFFIIQQLEAGIISPKIVGKCVGMHPVTVIFILLFWEKFFGIWGMFFAVPLTSIIIVIFEAIINKNVKIKG